MKRILARLALACGSLAITLTGSVGTAHALTVSPAGNLTASSGSFAFTLSSFGANITCTSMRIVGTVNTSGTGAVPAGGMTGSGCNSPLIGAFTVIQNNTMNWNFVLLRSPLGAAMTIMLPSGSTITLRGSLCNIVLTGAATISLLKTIAALPFSTSGQIFPITFTTGLSVSSSTCPVIGPPLAVTTSGNFAYSPNQTISG